MDIRFLPITEFHRIYFYRLITLAILVAIGVLALAKFGDAPRADLLFVGGCLLVMGWRFAVEWLRLGKCGPAFIHGDELVISIGDAGHRKIPLTKISSVRSRHSLFMVRRYRSWSEHVAFLELTLNDGERIYTLVEGAALGFPPGKESLSAFRAAVMAAKTRSLTA